MTTMVSLIPLLILLLIIVLFIALSKIRISFGKTNLVTGFYLLLLLTSIPVYYAIAEPKMSEPVKVIETGPGQYKYDDFQLNTFYDAFSKGRLNQYKHAEIVAQWNFDYQEERLKITAPEDEHYFTPIAVEKKDACDGKLEVFSYAPKFPKRLTLVNPPGIRLQANKLEISPPDETYLKAVQFYHDFTMAQFTGRGTSVLRMNYLLGHEVLYLRIPKDLLIDTDKSTEDYLNFINFKEIT